MPKILSQEEIDALLKNVGQDDAKTSYEVIGNYEKKVTPILSFKGNLHFTNREFANKLPFENGGQVRISRIFWGGRLMFINSSSLLKIPYYLSFGFELGDQEDKRQRYDNLEGTKGDKTFDQLEQFQNIAFFIYISGLMNSC